MPFRLSSDEHPATVKLVVFVVSTTEMFELLYELDGRGPLDHYVP